MTESQQKIYEGLKEIGAMISDLYADAVLITSEQCKLASKAHLLAHLAREISAGLMDILAPKEIVETLVDSKKYKERGNFFRIVTALGVDEADSLATAWFNITKELPAVAHRKAAYEESRNLDDILSMWNEFERILFYLIGSFYGVVDRLQHLLDLPQSSKDIIGALNNLLRNKKSEIYFFKNLNQPGWLEPLYEAGYFNVANAPKLIEGQPFHPLWLPLLYLRNISQADDKELNTRIAAIVNEIMNQYLNGGFFLHSYSVSHIAEIICELDGYTFDKIDDDFFTKFKKETIGPDYLTTPVLTEKLLKKYIQQNNKTGLLNLLNHCFSFYVELKGTEVIFEELDIKTEPYPEVNYLVEDVCFENHILYSSDDVSRICGIDVINLAIGKVNNLYKIDSYRFNSIASIAPSEQHQYGSRWENNLITFLERQIALLDKADLRQTVIDLYQSDNSILLRLALHFTRMHTHLFANLFFQYITTNKLNGSSPRHELSLLISEITPGLNEKDFVCLLDWIENYEIPVSQEQDQMNSYCYYAIRQWLEALKPGNETHEKILLDAKTKYSALNDDPISNPETNISTSAKFGYNAPIEEEEFLSLQIDQQIDYINGFSPNDHELSLEDGLAELVYKSIVCNPTTHLIELNKFSSLHSLYKHQILSAFVNLLESEKLTDYTSVLRFIEATLESDQFENEAPKRFPCKRWFVSEAANFINKLAKSDKYQLSKEDYESMVSIILTLLNSEEFKDNDDIINNGYHNHILNSVQGRLHLALIQLVHRGIELLNLKDAPTKWDDTIRNYFDSRLDRSKPSDKDYSIFVGIYFPYLLFIDREWTSQNVSRLFPRENEQHYEYSNFSFWAAARITRPALELLKETGLVQTAIESLPHESIATQHLVDLALDEYFMFHITLEDPGSVLNIILQNGNPVQITVLVQQLRRKKYLTLDDVSALWDHLIAIAKADVDKYIHLATELAWMCELSGKLDGHTTERLSFSVELLKPGNSHPFHILKELLNKAADNLENAGLLIERVFHNTDFQPIFQNQILQMVIQLYKNGYNEIANRICEHFAKHGDLTLKDVYNGHNHPQKPKIVS